MAAYRLSMRPYTVVRGCTGRHGLWLAPFRREAGALIGGGGVAVTYNPLYPFLQEPPPPIHPLPSGRLYSLRWIPTRICGPRRLLAAPSSTPSTAGSCSSNSDPYLDQLPTAVVMSVISLAIPARRADTGRPPMFSLAGSFPPIPAKLVKKIQGVELVEMRELLPDNIALSERLEALPVVARNSNSPQREVASVNTWTCAFAAYVAIVSQEHPNRV